MDTDPFDSQSTIISNSPRAQYWVVEAIDSFACALWFASVVAGDSRRFVITMCAAPVVLFLAALLFRHLEFRRCLKFYQDDEPRPKFDLTQTLPIHSVGFDPETIGLFAGKYVKTLVSAYLYSMVSAITEFTLLTPVVLLLGTLVSTACWPVGGRGSIARMWMPANLRSSSSEDFRG